jgi:ubiquinone/menaquinone biosynthesis C-methylase UbiE
LSPLSSEIKVLEADMLDLPFNDECFDVVIEKGTMVKRQCVGTSA